MVDFIRAPYRTLARLYPDDPEPFEIEWRVADDNAPLLGMPSAVNNLMFARDHDDTLATAVGEVYGAPRPFTRWAAFPLATGGHVCGTPDDFAGLGTYRPDLPPVQYRPDGLPRCCGAAVQGAGGGAGGGTATVTSTATYTGTGGAAGGGTATVYAGPVLVGGGAGGGTADVWSSAPLVGSGGGAGSGTADVSGYLTLAGGGAGGGTADVSGYLTLDGGGAGGGTADVSSTSEVVGSGGGAGSGTADVSSTSDIVGTGGGVGGGTADVSSHSDWPFCDVYRFEWGLVDEYLTRTSESTWYAAPYLLTYWGGDYWEVTDDDPEHVWAPDSAWDGAGAKLFEGLASIGDAWVSCADGPPP